MDRAGSTLRNQRGSVRLALLCALAGAAAVFVWSARQQGMTEAPTTSRQDRARHTAPDAPVAADAPPQPSAAPGVSMPRGAGGMIVGDATAREALAGDATDADGFSPDYGALVDDFQQQRALDPLVDE